MGGINVQALLDTGATCCLIGRVEADRLGLVTTDQVAKLVGVGTGNAFKAEPVLLLWGEGECEISPYILENAPGLPLVLGIPILVELGLRIEFLGSGEPIISSIMMSGSPGKSRLVAKAEEEVKKTPEQAIEMFFKELDEAKTPVGSRRSKDNGRK